jgi:1-phosphatidylinositol-4-phosphate 5-kinase
MSISNDHRTQASVLKKTLADSDPVPIEAPDTWDSPPQAQFAEQSIFYKDAGGIRGSDELDQPNDVVYYMGIIDILTPYNYAKKVEHYWKGMQYDRVSLHIKFNRYIY